MLGESISNSVLATNGTSSLAPPLSGGDLYIIVALTFALSLYLVMFIAIYAIRTVKTANDPHTSESVHAVLRNVVEGLTLVLVVLAVVILGLYGTIDAQGIVSILSAVAGYILGRNARPESTPKKPTGTPAQ